MAQVFCANCGAVGRRVVGLAVVFRPTGIDPQPHDWRDFAEYESWKASMPKLPSMPNPGRVVSLTTFGSKVTALVVGMAVAVAPFFAAWRIAQKEWVSAAGPILAFLACAFIGSKALPRLLPKLGFPEWHARLLWLPVVSGIMVARWGLRWADDPGATLGGRR
jgi:hypothetical protein